MQDVGTEALLSAPGAELLVPPGRDLGIQDTEQILGLGGLLFPWCIHLSASLTNKSHVRPSSGCFITAR